MKIVEVISYVKKYLVLSIMGSCAFMHVLQMYELPCWISQLKIIILVLDKSLEFAYQNPVQALCILHTSSKGIILFLLSS